MNDNLKEYDESEDEVLEESVVEETESTDEIESEELENAVELTDDEEESTEEVVVEPDKEEKRFFEIELKLLNGFLLRILKNTLDVNNIESNFKILAGQDDIVFEEDGETIKGLVPYPNLIVDCGDKKLELIKDEFLIEDGNGMQIKIHSNDKVYIRNAEVGSSLKGIVCGYGYNYDENDIEIDLVITFNGCLSFVRYMYSDQNIKLFTLGNNLSEEVGKLIKAIEQ